MRRGRLRRRTSLRRFAPLDRVAGLLKPPSRGGDPRARVCRLVDARSGRVCEWPRCGQPQAHRHHRLARKMGGRHGSARSRVNGAAWLLGICVEHHTVVTSPMGEVRRMVRDMGWVLVEGQDAPHVPVLTCHHPDPVYLAGDGGWATCEEAGT